MGVIIRGLYGISLSYIMFAYVIFGALVKAFLAALAF